MTALSLDDPRWAELKYRDGSANSIPDQIAVLLKSPSDIECFRNFWPFLCSEDTVWSAAYAAVPYIVQVAERLPSRERFEHLFFVGYVEMCSSNSVTGKNNIPKFLVKSYRQAIVQALHLTLETLLSPLEEEQTRYLLASIAALKGYHRLGMVINNLNFGCPECGTEILK